jgi:pyridoxine 4-dehydrogenase
MNPHSKSAASSAPQSFSKLGLGTGTLASLGRAASPGQVMLLLEAMRECGANVIDTADSYGSGDCEILLGRTLRRLGGDFRVITKAGYRLANFPGPLRPLNQFAKKAIQRLSGLQRFEPDYLRRSLEQSLRRLGRNDVDAFLLHDPGLDVVRNEEVLETCVFLRKAGKTAMIGVSSGDPDVIRTAIAAACFNIIQTPANISVAHTLRDVWMEASNSDIFLIGNHVYAPDCLKLPGINHETLMRACAGYFPSLSTILCGTRNPSHMKKTASWASGAMPANEAWELVNRLHESSGQSTR